MNHITELELSDQKSITKVESILRFHINQMVNHYEEVYVMDREWKHGVAAAVDVTLLGRFYERFADHAVEVARRVIFQVTGNHPDEEQIPAPR